MATETTGNTKQLVQCNNCYQWYEFGTIHSCIQIPKWTGVFRYGY
jgi:hypothetical protein